MLAGDQQVIPYTIKYLSRFKWTFRSYDILMYIPFTSYVADTIVIETTVFWSLSW